MSNTIESLRKQLAEAEENLRLIQERKSEYVLPSDRPLQLIKDERRLKAEIGALQTRLAEMEQAQQDADTDQQGGEQTDEERQSPRRLKPTWGWIGGMVAVLLLLIGSVGWGLGWWSAEEPQPQLSPTVTSRTPVGTLATTSADSPTAAVLAPTGTPTPALTPTASPSGESSPRAASTPTPTSIVPTTATTPTVPPVAKSSPITEAIAIITSQTGAQAIAWADSLWLDAGHLGSWDGLKLTTGQMILFNKMQSFEVAVDDSHRVSVTINLLDGRTVTDELYAQLAFDLMGQTKLGPLDIEIYGLKRVDFQWPTETP